VAKRREMGGKEKGDGWLRKGRWVAKLVARLLDTAVLWVRPDISQKFKEGDINKGEANTL
jgi:hypothetical protein